MTEFYAIKLPPKLAEITKIAHRRGVRTERAIGYIPHVLWRRAEVHLQLRAAAQLTVDHVITYLEIIRLPIRSALETECLGSDISFPPATVWTCVAGEHIKAGDKITLGMTPDRLMVAVPNKGSSDRLHAIGLGNGEQGEQVKVALLGLWSRSTVVPTLTTRSRGHIA